MRPYTRSQHSSVCVWPRCKKHTCHSDLLTACTSIRRTVQLDIYPANEHYSHIDTRRKFDWRIWRRASALSETLPPLTCYPALAWRSLGADSTLLMNSVSHFCSSENLWIIRDATAPSAVDKNHHILRIWARYLQNTPN